MGWKHIFLTMSQNEIAEKISWMDVSTQTKIASMYSYLIAEIKKRFDNDAVKWFLDYLIDFLNILVHLNHADSSDTLLWGCYC